MIISTEYFVLLWVLPVAVFIVLPLSLSFLWLIKYCIKEIAACRMPFIHTFLQNRYTLNGLQQRQEQRVPLTHTVQAEIADGAVFSEGIVANISRHGLCIQGLSSQALASCSKLLITSNNKAKQFHFEGRPCWSRKEGKGSYTIGLCISQPSLAWENLLPASQPSK